MSFFPTKDPVLGDAQSCAAVAHVIVPRSVDLGEFQVHRALPSAQSRMVGPFIFFDHFGPAIFSAGNGVDVRPHPHIGLATVTYLFDGEIVHRDSLGNAMPIHPGAVNWMTAGSGIVHSERTAPERRSGGEPLHGLQLWVALPAKDEETAAAFAHTAAKDIPELSENGMTLRVVAGAFHGLRSPVTTLWETLFADARLKAGTALPLETAHEERADALGAVDLVSGEREHIDGQALEVELDPANALCGIGVKGDAAVATERPDRRNVLDHADLVVHVHDRHESRIVLERSLDAPAIDAPGGVAIDVRHAETLALEAPARVEQRHVLDP